MDNILPVFSTLWIGLGRIPDIRQISKFRPDTWQTFDIRQFTGYPSSKISRIVLISNIRPDIENNRITGQAGYPDQPYLWIYFCHANDNKKAITYMVFVYFRKKMRKK